MQFKASETAIAVKKVTDMFGIEIIADQKRFCAAFSDLAPKLSKENKAFYVALSENLGKFYLRENENVLSGDKLPETVIRLAVSSIGEYLNEEKAEMVAYSIAYALGWDIENSAPAQTSETSTGTVIEELFRKADNGDNDACYNLGECFYYGRGVRQDRKKAVEWYTKAASRGDCSSQKKLAACWHNGTGTECDLSKAAYWYKEAAEQGDYDSQKALIMCFRIGGANLAPDEERAEKYAARYGIEDTADSNIGILMKEAARGDPDAQFSLGNCYFIGIETSIDYERAVMWYKKAAEQNYIPAVFNLAFCCASGTGVQQNPKEAVMLYKKAASAGDDDALNNLAGHYFRGDGVDEDLKTAAKLWLKAAIAGHARAQYNYGECKFNGWGVQKNRTEAASWYKKAASQSDPDAQYSLGWCSEHGEGLSKDYTLAKRMYEYSAQQGNHHAMKALGYLYANGICSDRDYAKAVEYFEPAAARGDKDSAKMLVYCLKYGGYNLMGDIDQARKIADRYDINFEEI